VVGGDVSASPSLTVAVTALGDLGGRKPVRRSGARAGDIVAMAGRAGHAAAGYSVLSRGFRSPRLLVDAYRRPLVVYPAGPAAAALGATSMIDVSDGLIADTGHLAQASGVAIDLRRDAFEIPDAMRDAASALGLDPYVWIFAGGDDHALVATFAARTPLGEAWRVIGTVGAGSGVTVDGAAWTQTPAGWDHFR
jgi:thiamine-monophosphate kinase